mgnify:CR=1 FL=1
MYSVANLAKVYWCNFNKDESDSLKCLFTKSNTPDMFSNYFLKINNLSIYD